jgi:ABC-type cobalt transport system substrate-binding protein
MNKKGQGLSINVIIIVAIALIVLIVLIAVFTGRMGAFTGGVADAGGTADKDCAEINTGYGLKTLQACQSASGQAIISKDSIADSSLVCCTA